MKQQTTRGSRILMIAPTPFFADRGCHVRILGEAKALINLGHQLLLCTYFLGRDVEGIPTERTMTVPWYKKLSAGPSWHKFYIDLLLLWKVLRACRKFRPDIIHAHLHEGIIIGKIASQLFKVPLVADLQGSLTDEILAHKFIPNIRFLVKTIRWVERKINQMPAHLIVSSAQTAQACVQNYGIAAERVTSVMDGVDLEIFSPREKDPSLQAVLGITPLRGQDES
jgi:glycosyltransferase involved in cell wall biosynthesis